MKNYPIVAVLWEDHYHVDRDVMIKNPEDVIVPVLTVGILYKKTSKTLTIVSDIEKYALRTDSSYTVILKSCVTSIKNYGIIELEDIH